MYNATNKALHCTLICATMMLASCTGDKTDTQAATALVDEAKTCIQNGDYQKAITLIDSIDKAYPGEVKIRRRAMSLRSEAMTGHLEKQLNSTDSLLAVYESERQKIAAQFTHVSVSGASGYYIMKGAYSNNISGTTAVQARVSDADASYYIVASNTGSKIGIDKVTLHGANGSQSTLPLSDSQRAGDIDEYGTDLATFAPSECDSLGQWAFNQAGAISSATISGSKGTRTVTFTRAQGDQFGQAWRLALLTSKVRDAMLLKDKLERQVIISRDHSANLSE